ncbi:RHS repeat-associated core domain-containing protein [Roseimicrobium gellanilyticum]|nr:RHS repeat-associated core domain-containing protein [Roseimicrobium gellanilyticum]
MVPVNPSMPSKGFILTTYDATNTNPQSGTPLLLDSALIISQVTVQKVTTTVGSIDIDGVKVTTIQRDQEPEEYVLYAAPDNGGAAGVWKYIRGLDGESVTDTGYVTPPGGGEEVRTVTTEKLKIDANGNELLIGKRKEIYKRIDSAEKLIRTEEGVAGDRVTYYSYYDDENLPDTVQGQLHIQLNPDGSWARYFYNADDGSISQTWTPWMDAGASTIAGIAEIPASQCQVEEVQTLDFPVETTTKITRIKGITVSRTVITKSQAHDGATGQAVDEIRTQKFSGSGELVSDTSSGNLQVGGAQVYFVEASGARTTYRSQILGGVRNITTTQGTVTYPFGVPGKSLQTLVQLNAQGSMSLERTNVSTGGDGHETASVRTYSYGNSGPGSTTITEYLDGIAERVSSQNISGVSTETDAAGVVKTTTTDAATGTSTMTLGTLSTIHSIHARPAGSGGATPPGYLERVQRSAAGQTRTDAETQVDEYGETVVSTDHLGRTSQYTYGLTPEGGRLVTETMPGGLTQIIASYRDGQPKSITGTGVMAEYYTYEVNNRGELLTTVHIGSANSPRWRRVASDGTGRVLREESPAVGGSGVLVTQHVYNGKGQRIKTIRPGLAAAIFEYDEMDQLYREGVDLNGDGVLNLTGASVEPVTEYETVYEKVNGYWWEVSRTRVHTGDGADGMSWRQREERRVLGLGPNEIRISYDESGASTVSTVAYDPAPSSQKRFTSTFVQRYGKTATSLRTETNGLLTSETSLEWNNVTSTRTYDAFRRVVTESGPEGTLTYTYDGTYDRIASITRQTGSTNRVTSYTYYGSNSIGAGRVQSVTAPCSSLSPTATATTYSEYDGLGNLTGQWGAGTYPVRYLHNEYGDFIKMWTYRTDTALSGAKPWVDNDYTPSPSASLTTWNYDAATGLLLNKRDSNNQGPSFTYKPSGLLETRTWARTVGMAPLVTSYAYDGAGRLTAKDYSDSTPDVSYGYYRDGTLRQVTDAAGTHLWDLLSTGAKREEFSPATRTWDGLSHIGKPTRESIGGTGWLAGMVVEQPVDRFGNKLRFQGSFVPAGVSAPAVMLPGTFYQHQDFETGQMVSIQYRMAGVPEMDFTRTTSYDGGSNRKKIRYTRAFESNTSFTSTTEIDPELGIVRASHAYEGTAPFQSRELSGSGVNAVDPDVTTWPTVVAAHGRWAYAHDARGQITEAVKSAATTSGGSTLATLTGWSSAYAYDDIGNRLQHTYGTAPFGAGQVDTVGYTSNARNQYTELANARKVHVSGAAPTDTALEINGVAANRHGIHYVGSITASGTGAKWEAVEIEASRTVGGIPYTSTHEGHVYVPPVTEALSYDADGNLTSDGRWNYTWDGENRLVGMTTHAAAVLAGVPHQALEFGYDYMSRRVRKKVSRYETAESTWRTASDLRFIYEGWNLMAEVEMMEERPPGATGEPGVEPHLVRSYVWGPDVSGTWEGAGGVGGLLGVVRHQQRSGVASAYMATWDLNGNVIGLVGTNGRVALYDYDAFGQVVRVNEPEPELCPIRFSTKYADAETGLSYYGYRCYDPVRGRWLSRDPINEHGGLNLYGMVENDLVHFIDPFGLKCFMTPDKVVQRSYKRKGSSAADVLSGAYKDPNDDSNWAGQTQLELLGVITTQLSGALQWRVGGADPHLIEPKDYLARPNTEYETVYLALAVASDRKEENATATVLSQFVRIQCDKNGKVKVTQEPRNVWQRPSVASADVGKREPGLAAILNVKQLEKSVQVDYYGDGGYNDNDPLTAFDGFVPKGMEIQDHVGNQEKKTKGLKVGTYVSGPGFHDNLAKTGVPPEMLWHTPAKRNNRGELIQPQPTYHTDHYRGPRVNGRWLMPRISFTFTIR